MQKKGDYIDLYEKARPFFGSLAFYLPWLSSLFKTFRSFWPVDITVYTFCNITKVIFFQRREKKYFYKLQKYLEMGNIFNDFHHLITLFSKKREEVPSPLDYETSLVLV